MAAVVTGGITALHPGSPSGAAGGSSEAAEEDRGAYVNFMMDEGQDRVKASFRENYDRLASVKHQYDPGNLFRVNQNIQPVAATV